MNVNEGEVHAMIKRLQAFHAVEGMDDVCGIIVGKSVADQLMDRIGIIGDVGGCKVTGLPSGTTSHEVNYLFGPRVYFPAHGRVYPYVQALFGGEQFSAGATGFGSASSSAFAMTAGGGADITLTRHVSFRAIQVEYLYTHFGGANQNNLRIQSGLVWRFGR